METRHFQTGPTGFADRTVSRPVVRISANAAMRIDATLSLSLSLSLSALQPHVSTVRLPSIHPRFHSIAMLFYSGTESSERARAFTDEKSGGERRGERKKKEWGRTERRRGEYIYIYTHTKHCSILIKARDLAIANRDETSPLSICRYVWLWRGAAVPLSRK